MSDFELLMVVMAMMNIVVMLLIELFRNTKKYRLVSNIRGYFFVIKNWS